MNRIVIALVAIALSITPCFARGGSHHSRSTHSHISRSSENGFAAGPNDTGGHDYARHIGKANAPKLSTGWTSGHGSRTHETHDYYRHTKTGRTIHVHGYYHRSSR